MRVLLPSFAALSLAACQTTTTSEEATQLAPPPYPPGYVSAGGKVPEIILANLPAGIPPEQVLITDNGCYYYHQGPATYQVKGPDGKQTFCLVQEEGQAPVTAPVDLTGVTLGAVPKT